MQFLYAQYLSNEHPVLVEDNLFYNIEHIFNIYIYIFSILLGIHNLNYFFKQNKLLIILSLNKNLREYLEKISPFFKKDYERDLLLFLKEITNLPIFIKYCSIKNKSFKDDKDFIISYYVNYFSKSEIIYDYIENNDLTYINDLYIAHVMVFKTLNIIYPTTYQNFKIYDYYKDNDSKNFIQSLFRKTILSKKEFNKLIKSTQWKLEKISIIDLIILHMSLCEFIYFPRIPPLSTINEYIEITKIFSTKKSKFFINGILDKFLRDQT